MKASLARLVSHSLRGFVCCFRAFLWVFTSIGFQAASSDFQLFLSKIWLRLDLLYVCKCSFCKKSRLKLAQSAQWLHLTVRKIFCQVSIQVGNCMSVHFASVRPWASSAQQNASELLYINQKNSWNQKWRLCHCRSTTAVALLLHLSSIY